MVRSHYIRKLKLATDLESHPLKFSWSRVRRTQRWRKAGAGVTSPEQAMRKLEGALNRLDLLPIGEKIDRMGALLSALRNPVKNAEFRFVPLLKKEEIAGIESWVRERLAAEKENLRDMKDVFSHWKVDLGKIGLKPEDISFPYKTGWYEHPGHELYYFYAPGMAPWYKRVVEKQNLQPSYYRPPEYVGEAISRRKAFGIGRMYREGKNTATIGLVQPLVFYKREPEVSESRGKAGTAHRVPLANPDLLMLYAQLKEAKEKNARVVNVKEEFWDIYGSKEKPPFLKVYERIGKLSHPFKCVEQATLEYVPGQKRVPREIKERKVLRAVFRSSPGRTR